MNTRHPLAACMMLVLLSAAGHAAQPVTHGAPLPPEEQIMQVLSDSPRMLIAHESIAAGQAQEQKLRAGPHEWQIAAMTQQRTDGNGRRTDEQEYELQRAVRWPWKYSLDRELGASLLEAGELSYADAWHEAGRDLLDLWFEWLAAEQSLRLTGVQVETLLAQQQAVARRVNAGDAPALELQLASAETRRLQAQRTEQARAAMRASEALAREFPGIARQLPEQLESPLELAGTDGEWIARITSDNHELELSEARADEARLGAERASRNRLPDPTLGLHYSDNIDGNRKLIGLTVTVPLGGRARSADAALARSAARAAQGNAQFVRDGVFAEARAVIADARLTYRTWQTLAEAAAQFQQAADATARGYALGEFDIGAMLVARRQSQEAQQQLMAAQLAAHRALSRVLLDAHQLWALPHDFGSR